MKLISLAALVEALVRLGYDHVQSDHDSEVLRSPTTGRPVVIPIAFRDSIPEDMVRHVLRDEPLELDPIIEAAVSGED